MDIPLPVLPPIPAAEPQPRDDKFIAILCHLSLFLGVGLILPFIIYLVKRTDSPLIAAHAREVLNFHLSLLIYSLCALPFVLILIGIPFLIALGVVSVICAIVAAIRASEGGFYSYPATIHFFR